MEESGESGHLPIELICTALNPTPQCTRKKLPPTYRRPLLEPRWGGRDHPHGGAGHGDLRLQNPFVQLEIALARKFSLLHDTDFQGRRLLRLLQKCRNPDYVEYAESQPCWILCKAASWSRLETAAFADVATTFHGAVTPFCSLSRLLGPTAASSAFSLFPLLGCTAIHISTRSYSQRTKRNRMPPKKAVQEEKILLGRPGNNLKSGIVRIPGQIPHE